MQKVKAETKYVKGSPRKGKPVADAVRGMQVEQALATLKYMQKGFAPKVHKTVKSAVANAVNNHGMQQDRLVVTDIAVNPAPMYKRISFESRGRVRGILKRNSHIVVYVGYPQHETNSDAQATNTAKKTKTNKTNTK